MRPATITSIVCLGASSALLDTQYLEVAGLNGIEGLNSLISTVGPAGTAVALIFDRGDDTLCSPVNSGQRGSNIQLVVNGGRSAERQTLHDTSASELFNREISKAIDAVNGFATTTNVLSVVLSNANKVRLEDDETSVQFLKRVISLLIFDEEIVE
jgi:hypothetical protein